jgi:hypothetical protein
MNLADEMEKQLTEEELEEFKEKYDATKLKTVH